MNSRNIEMIETIKKAGEILKERYFSSTKTTIKEKYHLLSETDLEINEYLITNLKQEYSDYVMHTEETPNEDVTASKRLLIDPIDGTTNFITGKPYFTISIAVEEDGKITQGHVYNPITEEYFYSNSDIKKSGSLAKFMGK